jgi:hypothetical protein
LTSNRERPLELKLNASPSLSGGHTKGDAHGPVRVYLRDGSEHPHRIVNAYESKLNASPTLSGGHIAVILREG